MMYRIYLANSNSAINILLFVSVITMVACSTLRTVDTWLDTVLTGVSPKHISETKEIFHSKDLHSLTDFQEVVDMKHGDTSFLLGDWGLKEGVAAKISKAIRDSDIQVARHYVGDSKRPLTSLSVDEVVTLFKNLNLPSECEPVIRRELYDGRVLNEISSLDEVKELELPLSAIKAKVLLKCLDDYRISGDDYRGISGEVSKHLLSPLFSADAASYESEVDTSDVTTTTNDISSAASGSDGRTTSEDGSSTTNNGFATNSMTSFTPEEPPAATTNINLTTSGSAEHNNDTVSDIAADTDSSATTAQSKPFFIAPDDQLTTVDGISDSLNRILGFLEVGDDEDSTSPSNGNALKSLLVSSSSMRPPRENQFLAEVLNAIPIFIGDDEKSIKRMKVLGASETKVIENLKKLIDVLLMAVALPSDPSYSVVSKMLRKALIAAQKMMRYNDSDVQSSCYKNIELFGRIGTIESLIEAMAIQLQYKPTDLKQKELVPLVLIECSKTIRDITLQSKENEVKYGVVPGSVEVLLETLRNHGWSNTDVAVACCEAIATVNWGVPTNRAKFGAVEGSIEALVDVLRVHGRSNADVAAACSKAIGSISAYNINNQIQYGAILGSMGVLVDVLKTHGQNNLAVAEVTSWAIYWVNLNNEKNQGRYQAVSGSVEVLVDVLKAHGRSSATVAHATLSFISNAASRIGYDIASDESIKLLADVLQAHGENNLAVASTSCSIIKSIAAASKHDHQQANFESTVVFAALEDVLKAHGKTDTEESSNTVNICSQAIVDLSGNTHKSYRANSGDVDLNAIQVLEEEEGEEVATVGGAGQRDGSSSTAAVVVVVVASVAAVVAEIRFFKFYGTAS